MPYAMVEDKIAKVSPQYRGELLAFIDFLIFKQGNDVSSDGAAPDVVRSTPKRKAGGLTGDFYMAPDFDEPLECFKEYMCNASLNSGVSIPRCSVTHYNTK